MVNYVFRANSCWFGSFGSLHCWCCQCSKPSNSLISIDFDVRQSPGCKSIGSLIIVIFKIRANGMCEQIILQPLKQNYVIEHKILASIWMQIHNMSSLRSHTGRTLSWFGGVLFLYISCIRSCNCDIFSHCMILTIQICVHLKFTTMSMGSIHKLSHLFMQNAAAIVSLIKWWSAKQDRQPSRWLQKKWR